MNYNSIIILIISLVISTILIPIIIHLSRTFKIYDRVDERKLHHENISRLGGLGIFIAFLIPYIAIIIPSYQFNFNIYLYLVALVMAFTIGFIDDIWELNAKLKFILQIITAILVVCSGLTIKAFSIFGLLEIEFGPFAYIITIIWIVVFINAINLLDGMDGLASGIVLLANLFIFYIALANGQWFIAETIVILGGSIFGFYIFNFPPAKIFMGDGGAYFLGFMYATLPLMGIQKIAIATIFLFPLILLLVPLLDIARVITMRAKSGINIFKADKNHLHHRLLNMGFSIKGILFIMYSLTIILGSAGVLLIHLPKYIYILFAIISFTIFINLFIINSVEKVVENYEKTIENLKQKDNKQ